MRPVTLKVHYVALENKYNQKEMVLSAFKVSTIHTVLLCLYVAEPG